LSIVPLVDKLTYTILSTTSLLTPFHAKEQQHDLHPAHPLLSQLLGLTSLTLLSPSKSVNPLLTSLLMFLPFEGRFCYGSGSATGLTPSIMLVSIVVVVIQAYDKEEFK